MGIIAGLVAHRIVAITYYSNLNVFKSNWMTNYTAEIVVAQI